MVNRKAKWVFDHPRSGHVSSRSWIVAAVVAYIFIFDKRFPNWVFYCFLGIILVVFVSNVLRALGDQITLENEELVRVSWFGAITARIPLSAIGPGSFKTKTSLFQVVYLLSANGQNIRFSAGISDIGKLLELILTSVYGVKAPFSPGPDPNLALGTYSNHFGAAFLFGGSYLLRKTARQIEVSQAGIQWIDWSGHARQAGFADFIPGSMTWNWDGGCVVYKIETKKGQLTWSGQLKDCAKLSYFLRSVALQPYLPLPTYSLPVYPGARPGVRESAVIGTKA